MTTRHYYFRQPNFRLMQAFGVTEADIMLNREGKLSQQQNRRIWRDRLPAIMGFTLIWVCMMIIYSAFRIENADSTSAHILALFMVVSLLVAVGVILRAWRKMSLLQVQVAAGIVNLERRQGRYGGLYLYIDGRSFELQPKQYDSLRDKMSLAVYYVEPRKRILSVESIVFHQHD